jgi:putative methyltransferase (TIGR04325 family)
MGKLYQRLIGRIGYFGNYTDYHDASRASTGYDSDLILERVRRALLKVKNGEAPYERDSVLFDEVHYSWPLLAALLWISSCNENRLNLIDFGGSLGSSYFQNRGFLTHMRELSWNVVEQANFVRCGREQFEDQSLKFYSSIDECLATRHSEAILLSSVLPYLEKPYDLLGSIIERKVAYILIDRTPVLEGGQDRLTVQRVPPEIYEASYPAWILSEQRMLSLFAPTYELISRWEALGGSIFLGNELAYDRGFIFRLKE